MLDIETMGTGSNAAIVSIGAVRFDDNGVTDKFDKVVNLTSCLFAGFDINQETIDWWRKQSTKAQKTLLRRSVSISRVLTEFSDWIGEDAVVWGNGSDFDNVILSNAYKVMEKELPWKFYKNRCYRSVKALYPDIEIKRVGTHHNAVDDAESQALHLIAMIGGSGLL